MSAATDALEEIKEALVLEVSQRRAREDENKESFALKALAKEIRNFAEKVADASVKREEEDVPVAPSSQEIPEILQEMRKLSTAAVGILNRPVERNVTPVSQAAPIVNVAAPSVSVSPNVVVERNNTRFRVVVTAWALPPGSPPGSQLRIQELIIEPIA